MLENFIPDSGYLWRGFEPVCKSCKQFEAPENGTEKNAAGAAIIAKPPEASADKIIFLSGIL